MRELIASVLCQTGIKSLPSGPVNIHNFDPTVSIAIKMKNTIQLQRLANQRNQAFRVNGTTFSPKNKVMRNVLMLFLVILNESIG